MYTTIISKNHFHYHVHVDPLQEATVHNHPSVHLSDSGVHHDGATAVEKEGSILASPPSTHPAVGVKTLSPAAATHVDPKSTPKTAEKLKNHGAAASGLRSPPSTTQEPPPLTMVTASPSASPVMTPLFLLHYRRSKLHRRRRRWLNLPLSRRRSLTFLRPSLLLVRRLRILLNGREFQKNPIDCGGT